MTPDRQNNMFIDVLEVQKAYHKYRKTYISQRQCANDSEIRLYVIFSTLIATQQKIKIVQSALLEKNDVSLSNTSLINEDVCLSLSDSLHLLYKTSRHKIQQILVSSPISRSYVDLGRDSNTLPMVRYYI